MDTKLRRLRLAWMAQSFEAQNTESIRGKQSYLEFLGALVDGELESRDNKGLMKRVKAAHFPLAKTLEEFNFDFQPNKNQGVVLTDKADGVVVADALRFVGPQGAPAANAQPAASPVAAPNDERYFQQTGYRIGEDHQNARYTDGEIEMVLSLRDDGKSYGEIATLAEMPKSTVRDICKGNRRCQCFANWKTVRVSGGE